MVGYSIFDDPEHGKYCPFSGHSTFSVRHGAHTGVVLLKIKATIFHLDRLPLSYLCDCRRPTKSAR